MSRNISEYIEYRLKAWANWYSRGDIDGVGYPGCSMEYRMMNEVVDKTTGVRPMPYNEEAEEIENMVNQISKHNIKIAAALRIRYFGQGELVLRAEQIGLTYPCFRSYVSLAKYWMMGRFSVCKNI